MWWIPVIVLVGLFVSVLALSEIFGWFEENKTPSSEYGELIRERLRDGNYKVVAGIFNKRDVRTAQRVWETEELDKNLEELFRGRNRIRVEI